MLDDPASCVVTHFVCAMRDAFKPDRSDGNSPIGGGSDTVRIFGGEALPLAYFTAHTKHPKCGCNVPFLWVRAGRRYKTKVFPTPYVGDTACDLPWALEIQIGVGRCAVIGLKTSWEDYEREADINLDDGNHLAWALCWARQLIANDRECEISGAMAIDSITPIGPEGGIIAQAATAYVQL